MDNQKLNNRNSHRTPALDLLTQSGRAFFVTGIKVSPGGRAGDTAATKTKGICYAHCSSPKTENQPAGAGEGAQW